jgi:hypothetical protein
VSVLYSWQGASLLLLLFFIYLSVSRRVGTRWGVMGGIDWLMFDDDFFQVMCFHFMARSVSSALDLFVSKEIEKK